MIIIIIYIYIYILNIIELKKTKVMYSKTHFIRPNMKINKYVHRTSRIFNYFGSKIIDD